MNPPRLRIINSQYSAPPISASEDHGAPKRKEPIETASRTSSGRRRPVTAPATLRDPLASLLTSLSQGSLPEDGTDSKKPRRSDRLAHADPDKTPVSREHQLPSPVTNNATEGSTELPQEHTATPPVAVADELTPRKAPDSLGQSQALSSPPQDTQPLSQFIDRHPAFSDDVVDEIKEGVWGYLVPLDPKYGDKPLVLKKRVSCPLPDTVEAAADGAGQDNKESSAVKEEEAYEKTKVKGVAAGGYLIGRHPECGKIYLMRLVPSFDVETSQC